MNVIYEMPYIIRHHDYKSNNVSFLSLTSERYLKLDLQIFVLNPRPPIPRLHRAPKYAPPLHTHVMDLGLCV